MNTVTLTGPNYKGKIYGLNQWDVGQTLRIYGLADFSDCDIYWAYSALALVDEDPVPESDKQAITPGTDGVTAYGDCIIPNDALIAAGTITGTIYRAGDTSSETVGVVTAVVEAQPMPEDYASSSQRTILQDLVETAVDAAMPTFEIGEVEAGEAPAAELVETETGYALGLTLQTGATGPQGPQGPSPEFSIGSVDSGPEPTVSLIQTTGGYIFDIVMPQGDYASVVREITEDDYLHIVPDDKTIYIVTTGGVIHVQAVYITDVAGIIEAGTTLQLTHVVLPTNADDKSVTWTSSNTNIATVSSTGLVTAVAEGTANITCTSTDGNYTDVQYIEVVAENATINVTGVSLNLESDAINPEDTIQLTETVSPANATDKTVQWTSSNTNIATVSSTGLVTGVATGTATITCTTNDGDFTDSFTITVETVNYPALWQGTKTLNGITFTISGNEVTLNGTKNNNDYTAGSAYYTENVINIFNAPDYDAWFNLAYGDSISLKITKISGTHTGLGYSNAAVAIRDTSNNILASLIWQNLSNSPQTISYTAPPGGKNIRGIFSYIDTNAVLSSLKIKIECTVKGTVWF
jgi:uncharacterized protein YjdB